MQEAWLKCSAGPGMFSDEYSVEIESSEGKKLSFFATKDIVKSDAIHQYLLKVDLISGTQISLPSETFETGTTAVNVHRDSLVLRS